MSHSRIENPYRAAAALRPRRMSSRVAAAVAAGLLVSGCTTPMSRLSAFGPAHADVTGSITTRAALDGHERSLAAAIRAALEPVTEGAQVAFIDPKTGRRGTVAATGPAFVSRDRLCRAFTVVSEGAGGNERSAGGACRIGAGPWTFEDFAAVPERA
jgi:surface antigen